MKFKKLISALAAVSMLSSVFVANAFAAIDTTTPIELSLKYTDYNIDDDDTYGDYAETYDAYKVSFDLTNGPTSYDRGTKKGDAAIYQFKVVFDVDGSQAQGEDEDWWFVAPGSSNLDLTDGKYTYMVYTTGTPLYNKNASIGDANDAVSKPVLLVKKTAAVKLTPTTGYVMTDKYENAQPQNADVKSYSIENGLLKFETTTAAGKQFGTPVSDPVLTSVDVTPASITMKVCELGKKLTAVAKDADGETFADATISWEVVTGKDVVSVDNAGNVTALKKGTATVKAKATPTTGDAVYSNEVTITVKPAKPTFKPGDGHKVVKDENVIGWVWNKAKIEDFMAGTYTAKFTKDGDSKEATIDFGNVEASDLEFVMILNTIKDGVSFDVEWTAE